MQRIDIQDREPIRIELNQGEVRRYELHYPRGNNISHELWGDIRTGLFTHQRPARHGYPSQVLYRAAYKKEKINNPGHDNAIEDILFVSIDTRFSTQHGLCQDDPNFGRIIDVTVVEPAVYRDCILSIDLGNTRTVALIVDNIDDMHRVNDDPASINVYPLPLLWSEYPIRDPLIGCFDSIISLTNSDCQFDALSFDDCRWSFVKLGDFAVWNNLACRRFADAGKYTLSSPKRYYWDNDPVDMTWIAARYTITDNEVETVVENLDGVLAETIAQQFNQQNLLVPSNLPPAAMLGAMLVELYEQACYYISSYNFKRQTNDIRPRKISEIHVTYPSTLSFQEREFYTRQLRAGLNAYQSLCQTPGPQISLCSDIDEATSVVALYTYSEIRKYSSAKFWLQSHGRRKAGGYATRIAVIDIGGGTTDLSISEVFALDIAAVDEPMRASINLIYRDGINTAGDNFVLNFLRDCIADIVFQSILDRSGIPPTEIDRRRLREIYNNPENCHLIRGLKRTFWFDIVIIVASKCDKMVLNGLTAENELIHYTISAEAASAWNNLLRSAGREGHVPLEGEELSIKITENVVNKYRKAIQRTFGRVARSFGSSVNAFDVDIVLFSGKTSEFSYVRSFFLDYMPVSPQAVRAMQDFYVGTWCPGITDRDGSIRDSKISTALGGALYSLRERAFVTMDFRLENIAANPNCNWGIVQRDRIAFADPLFQNGNEESIRILNVPRLIARQSEFASTAILSYEVRVKPEILVLHPGGVDAGASVTIAKDPRSMRLSLSGCDGRYNDGQELKLEDIECRICNLSSTFGLDDDSI